MEKLTKMGRANARMVVESLRETLREAAKEFGVNITLGNWRYDDSSVSTKLEVHLADTTALDDVKEWEFKAYARQFGLSSNDFGKTVQLRAGRVLELFQIVGIAPKSHKYPILVKRASNGKVYKYEADQVIAALQK